MIKVVIFDFDDTLYSNTNPKPWRDYCLNTVSYFLSKHKNYSSIKEELQNRSFSDRQLITYLKSYGLKEKTILEYFKTHEPAGGGSTFDGCVTTSNYTLAEFAKNFKLFIVSNSTKESVIKNMEYLNIDDSHFSDIISNSEKSKKNIYKNIIMEQKISPNELLVIGNSFEHDVSPALILGAEGRVVKRADFSFKDFFDKNGNLKNYTMNTFEGYMHGINFGLWLSQYNKFDLNHFDTYNTQKDVEFIASLGYDHIRLPFDYELFNKKEIGFKYLDTFISWCEKYNLNVILDLHRTNGYSFDTLNKNSLFENKDFQDDFVALWKCITFHYIGKKENVCFELLNEVVLEEGSEEWIKLYKRTLNEIRKIDPDRKILIGSNMYSSPQELEQLELVHDPNVIYTFHFYKPILFTHQKASWNEYAHVENEIAYPLTKDVYNNEMKKLNLNCRIDTNIDISYLEKYIKMSVDFAKKNNVICYCGEFGVIDNAKQDSTLRWFKDLVFLFKKYNIGHAVWNYKEKQFQFQNFQTGKPNMELFRICCK